jgi:hypothetical protein
MLNNTSNQIADAGRLGFPAAPPAFGLSPCGSSRSGIADAEGVKAATIETRGRGEAPGGQRPSGIQHSQSTRPVSHSEQRPST